MERPFCGRWPRLCRGVIWKRILRTCGLLLDEKMDATIDEDREGEDLELDAQELANTPVDSPSHSCG